MQFKTRFYLHIISSGGIMNKSIIFTVLSSILLVGQMAYSQSYKTGLYELDPAHTSVTFSISHLVVSEIPGRFNDVSGVFVIDKDFKKSMMDVQIKTNSIDTGIQKRDDHLKTADFFDVKKYPYIRFKSKRIVGDYKSFKILGSLTIKDITKDVEIDAKYTGSIEYPKDMERAAFQGTMKINRKDFNINYNEKVSIGSAVGDEVILVLRTEGILKSRE